MARLIVADDWRGRGEKKTASILENQLPGDWTIIAGKKLPDADSSDADFIVIGKNFVYVLEEKAWRGTIVISSDGWNLITAGRFTKSPQGSVNYKARILSSYLADNISNLSVKTQRHRLLKAFVVMSDENVNFQMGPGAPDTSNILLLNNFIQDIVKYDASVRTGFEDFRNTAIRILSGLPNSDQLIHEIREYQVSLVEELPDGRMLYKGAHKHTGQEVHIKCFPQFLFGQDNPETYFEREIKALRSLDGLDRTWRLADAFVYEPRNWFCVVTELPTGNRTLRNSVRNNDPQRAELGSNVAIFNQIALDAFEGLNAIAATGLVHRGLSPDRIWLGNGMRVYFGEFNLCHIDDAQTVLHWIYADSNGEPFRSPECVESIASADHKSDVYSLSLLIAGWYTGNFNESREHLELVLSGIGPVGKIITLGLSEHPAKRPSASEMCNLIGEALTEQLEEKAGILEQSVAANSKLLLEPEVRLGENDRYELLEKLGSGAEAVIWKAFDHQRSYPVVLKFLHTKQMYDLALHEHLVVNRLQHPRIARSLDISPIPEPGYLVQEFKVGFTLNVSSKIMFSDADKLRNFSIDLFDILQYLEKENVVHADITPRNIIVSDGEPVLIDFGLTTSDGKVALGFTKIYAAPEVVATHNVTKHSDLYSASCSILETALGRRPYDVDDQSDQRVLIGLTEAEREIWGESGSAVLNALFRGINNDPNLRPKSASAFIELLRAARPIPELVKGAESLTNPNVDEIRKMYKASVLGNAQNRGLDSEFSKQTYVKTPLDIDLIPSIIAGDFSLVALTGNPGDGKTALIRMLQIEIELKGGTVQSINPTRWEYLFQNQIIVAILDASESSEALSSDENLKWALERVGKPNFTAVIAANDGRLLDFFTRNWSNYESFSDDVLDSIIDDAPPTNEKILVLDLKTRALVDLDGLGTGSQIIDSLTSDKIWNTCLDCALNSRCPIFANRNDLKSTSKQSVLELVLMSHLRGQRRSTIRDLRSALAWIITGDKGCADVASASELGRNIMLERGTLLHDLLFSPNTKDQLLEEWASVDPGLVTSPGVERIFREQALESPDDNRIVLGMENFKRSMFAGSSAGVAFDRSTLSPIRHMGEYLQILRSCDDDSLQRLLMGLSRIVGAHGYSGAGLAVADRFEESRIAVLKIAKAEDFRFEVYKRESKFLQSIPEYAIISHVPTGAKLRVTLELAEILLRSFEGEILNDSAIESYRQELQGFAMAVSRERSNHALLVDANSNAWKVEQNGLVLELEEQNSI